MPRPLRETENPQSVQNWLEANLTNIQPFPPKLDAIPHGMSKGICFWFMKREGYQIFNEHINNQAAEAKYSREINEDQFALVYLEGISTADKTITETLNWHIRNVEDINALKRSSPLRKVIGALLSNDLLEANIQTQVSNFICSNMMVFVISGFDCEYDKISNTASILKSRFSPLFAESPPSTSMYKEIMGRTDIVYYETRRRIEGVTYDYLKYFFKHEKQKDTKIAEWIVEHRWNCDNISQATISLINEEINNGMGDLLNKRLNIDNKGVIVFKLFKEKPETEEQEMNNDNAIWQSQDLSGWRYTRSANQDLLGYFQNSDSDNIRRKYESILNIMNDLPNIYCKFYYLNS